MELKERDIVWTDAVADEDGIYESYHIVVGSLYGIRDTSVGCWCPKEAVDFLNNIGILASPSNYYSSGFKAPGCTWVRKEKPMSPHVQLAFNTFTGVESNNKSFVYLLEKPED